MKKIAIFVSGAGLAAARIVSLFNEGNRLKTVLVIASDSGKDFLDHIKDKDVTFIHIPDIEWNEKIQEIRTLLKENEIDLLVFDNFEETVPDELLSVTEGKFVAINDPDIAPREVVSALEAENHPKIADTEEEPKEEKGELSPEEEWAAALKINFVPPKVPESTPPPVPEKTYEGMQENVKTDDPDNQVKQNYYNQSNIDWRDGRKEDTMPPTYLIWSILCAVFCCIIPGVVAIIFSSQVSSKFYAGDIDGARKASRMAEIWIIVSVIVGVLAATLYVPLMFIGG